MANGKPDVLNALQQSIRGQVITPDGAGYDQARAIWNGMIDRRPAGIVRCVGTADVIATVKCLRDHDVPFTIRGGGHNIAGLAVADGAVMIDLSQMRGAWVDGAAGTVHTQP